LSIWSPDLQAELREMAEYVEDTGDGSITLRRHTAPTRPADTRDGPATVAAVAPAPAPPAAPLASDADGVASGVRVRVLVPLAVALVLMVLAVVWIFVLETQSRQAEDMARTAASVEAMLQKKSTDGVALLRSVMELTMGDTRLEQAFRARDRDTLLALSTPIFDELRSRNRVTHFYFILPDRTTLLRVQSPEAHGDKIERLVLREAQQTGQPAWGNEQGPFGAFPLRVVYPWRSTRSCSTARALNWPRRPGCGRCCGTSSRPCWCSAAPSRPCRRRWPATCAA
jgi:hypothetical protein